MRHWLIEGLVAFNVFMLVYLAVLVVSLAAGIASTPLGGVGRGLVNWAVTVAVAPIPALSASVLYFSLRVADEPAVSGVGTETADPL